jgi:WD40 repeat protein
MLQAVHSYMKSDYVVMTGCRSGVTGRQPGCSVLIMARVRESLWLWAGTSFMAAGTALVGVAAVLAAREHGYRLWSGPPMVGVYVACALGVGCLWAAARDWSFPFAADRSGGVQGARVWGAPPVVGWVNRAELAAVVSALTDAGERAVALTTGLVGAGGFGKTMLAAQACQDAVVRRRFPGGICWVTVGRDLDGEGLAQRISEAVWNLGGGGPAFASIEEAARALAGALAARRRMLLVADDVWTGGQLAPFVTAGQAGRLLVTTRRPAVLTGAGVRQVQVDAVPGDVARQILAWGLPPMAGQVEEGLLQLAGGWPLLLGLINGRLREELGRGGDIDAAAREASDRLRRDGPAALDIQDAQSRRMAVAATIGYSLDTLDGADQDRFYQLGIFAGDVEVPLPLLTTLWQVTAGMSETDAIALCERLNGLSLVSLVWARGSKAMVVHDVIRDFARRALGRQRVAELNDVLLVAVAAGLPAPMPPRACNGGLAAAWWELGDDDRYLRGQLIWHLIEARRGPEAEALASDLQWAGGRLVHSGPAALAADLALVGTSRTARMAAAIIRVAHLLAPAGPVGAVVDILHSRLAVDPDWGPQVSTLRDTDGRSRLVNRWLLPDLPSPALRAVLEGHQGWVSGVCAVTVGERQLLASVGGDRTVRIWDPATGAQQALLRGHQGWVNGVCAVTVAGRVLLASGSDDQTVRIWDPATGAQQALLQGHQDAVTAVCAVTVAERQLLASGSDDQTVRIWDPATGAQQAVLEGHQGMVRGVCGVTVAERQLLASGSDDQTVRIWDPATGAQQTVLRGHQGWVSGVCAVTVGERQLLASASGDRTVRIWDPATGAQQGVLQGHQGWVNGLCTVMITERQLLASVGGDRTVRIWDPATRTQQEVLKGHQDMVRGVCAVTVAGRVLLASGSDDRTVRIWDSDDQTVRIWDLTIGAQQTVQRGHQGTVRAVCAVTVAGQAVLASAGDDQTVRIWDPATGAQEAVLQTHEDAVTAVCAVTVAGRVQLASASLDGTIRIWDLATGAQQVVLGGHQGWVYGLCAVTVAERQLLASAGNDQTVRIWDPATGAQQTALRGHQGTVRGVCAVTVAERQLLASAGDDQTVRIWDPATGAQQTALQGHQDAVTAVCAVTVAGQAVLASASSDRTVRIWDPATGQPLALMRVERPLHSCAWIDSQGLTAGGDEGVYGFDLLLGAIPGQ